MYVTLLNITMNPTKYFGTRIERFKDYLECLTL
jgi:hypothetical protein